MKKNIPNKSFVEMKNQQPQLSHLAHLGLYTVKHYSQRVFN
jgi:hypothetical protein